MKAVAVMLALVLAADQPQEQATKNKSKQIKRGDLVGNMLLLNLWGEKPESVQRLYQAAYKVLASRRDASFADLAGDATFQRLCNNNGVSHLGGPMLDIRYSGDFIQVCHGEKSTTV